MEDRDVVIVGGGPAGYTAAIRVMQLGGKATIVEKDIIGGICVNHGCIPTVALARAVELLEMGKHAKDYGITYKDMTVDFRKDDEQEGNSGKDSCIGCEADVGGLRG